LQRTLPCAGACASGGGYKTPHVTEKLADAGGKVIYRTETEQYRLLEEEAAAQYFQSFVIKETEEGASYRYTETCVPSGRPGRYHRMAMVLVPAEHPVAAAGICLEHCRRPEGTELTEIAEQIAAYFAAQ